MIGRLKTKGIRNHREQNAGGKQKHGKKNSNTGKLNAYPPKDYIQSNPKHLYHDIQVLTRIGTGMLPEKIEWIFYKGRIPFFKHSIEKGV